MGPSGSLSLGGNTGMGYFYGWVLRSMVSLCVWRGMTVDTFKTWILSSTVKSLCNTLVPHLSLLWLVISNPTCSPLIPTLHRWGLSSSLAIVFPTVYLSVFIYLFCSFWWHLRSECHRQQCPASTHVENRSQHMTGAVLKCEWSETGGRKEAADHRDSPDSGQRNSSVSEPPVNKKQEKQTPLSLCFFPLCLIFQLRKPWQFHVIQ